MISAFLMDACIDLLKTTYSWTDREIGIRPSGQPSSLPRDFFVGFFGKDNVNSHLSAPQGCISMDIEFTIRVSMLTRMVPKDRFDKMYFENTISIARTSTKIMKTLLDNRETLRSTVNTALTNATEEYNAWMGLMRTFTWMQTQTELTERDNEWFHSSSKNHNEFNHAGYSQDIVFGKARGFIRIDQ